MDIYFEMAKKPIFNLKDIEKYYGNKNSAISFLQRLLKSGKAINIRRGMYTCISPVTGAPIANKYQIASALSEDAAVSYHSAMEYYGLTDQIFYDVYVSSSRPFKEFDFDGITYHYVKSSFSDGILVQPYSNGVRVTDLERTVVDSIKQINRIAGAEEVLANISGIKRISEKKLLEYLALYDNQFLYQKCGFFLSKLVAGFELSDVFFEECKKHIGNSKRYLMTEKKSANHYDKEWRLIVPDNIFNMKNGVFEDADI